MLYHAENAKNYASIIGSSLFRKDAGASGLLCLLHMQVAIVRHRLSCVGFAGNNDKRTNIHVDRI